MRDGVITRHRDRGHHPARGPGHRRQGPDSHARPDRRLRPSSACPHQLAVVAPPPSVTPSSPSPAADIAPQAFALDKLKLADALKARDSGLTTALVISREGVLPGRSVLVNLSGKKTEDMVLRQPAALHLHMNELSQPLPEFAHGHGGPRAPGSLRRPALLRRVGGLREVARGKEASPLRRHPRGLARRGDREARPSSSRPPAPTTSAAPCCWPTSSRSRWRWRAHHRPRGWPPS